MTKPTPGDVGMNGGAAECLGGGVDGHVTEVTPPFDGQHHKPFPLRAARRSTATTLTYATAAPTTR